LFAADSEPQQPSLSNAAGHMLVNCKGVFGIHRKLEHNRNYGHDLEMKMSASICN
jgi:hypothetical protein